MSITSGPIEPLYSGSSIAGLPSENDRVALTLDGVIMGSSWLVRTLRRVAAVPHLCQHLTHGGAVDLARRLGARQQQVEQVVVGQIHQRAEPFGLALRDA